MYILRHCDRMLKDTGWVKTIRKITSDSRKDLEEYISELDLSYQTVIVFTEDRRLGETNERRRKERRKD